MKSERKEIVIDLALIGDQEQTRLFKYNTLGGPLVVKLFVGIIAN